MRRFHLYAVLAVSLYAFVSPAQTRADGIDNFMLSDGFGNTITWQLPASPSPAVTVVLNPGRDFALFDVPATVDGAAEFINAIFGNQAIGGGISVAPTFGVGSFIESDSFLLSIVTAAPQLYTGPESAPTFLTGTFSFPVNSFAGGVVFEGRTSGTLTITPNVSPVPEPSTLLLLCAGLLGMGVIFLSKHGQ